jgi:tRNA A37 threonylcarbamoyltransferase TsaD
MASENGEFKGEVKAKLAFNDKEHEKLCDMIETSEMRLLHAIEMIDKAIQSNGISLNTIKKLVYTWNGGLTVAVGVGAYLAILLIEHLLAK